MREPILAALFAFPVAIYVGVVTLASVAGGNPVFLGTFALTFALSVATVVQRGRVRSTATTALIAVGLASAGALVLGVGGVDLYAGLLVAVPGLLVAYAVQPDLPVGWRIFALALALGTGLALLATRAALLAADLPATGPNFLGTFGTVVYAQASGLYALLQGTAASLPLRDLYDPAFILLGAVAAVGVFVPVLRPTTAWDEPLPTDLERARWSPDAGEEGAAELGPSLASALEHRSIPESPAGGLPPGVVALAVATVAAGLVVALEFELPQWTLIAVAAGVMAALLAACLATSSGRPRRARPTRVAVRRAVTDRVA